MSSPTEYTLRTSALRIESPVLKQDALYTIRCSRRDFSSSTQFSATSNFGVAIFRSPITDLNPASSVAPNRQHQHHRASTTTNIRPHHHERTFSGQAAPLSTQASATATPASTSMSFPARESLYWERPACLLHFKPATTSSTQSFAPKLLKIEIVESLHPVSAPQHSSSPTRASLSQSTSSVVGSIEIDLSMFLPGGKEFHNKNEKEEDVVRKKKISGDSNEHLQFYVPQYRIPVRFGNGNPMTDVGGYLFMSFRFDTGDDRVKSQQVMNHHNIVTSGSNAQTTTSTNDHSKFHHADVLDDTNDHDDDNAAAAAASAASNAKSNRKMSSSSSSAHPPQRKNNTSGKAISTVLPIVNTSVSAVGVLQDLLNMLSDEKQEEPLLIHQINELTEQRKTLVVSNFFGGDAAMTSPASGSTSLTSPFSSSSKTSRQVMIDDLQERLSTATAELLRTVCCDRIVMMYKSGLNKAMDRLNHNCDDNDEVMMMVKQQQRFLAEVRECLQRLQRSKLWSEATELMEKRWNR